MAEALGYLGGALAIIGLALLVGRHWGDIGTAGRLILSAVAAAGLFGAGALVHDSAEPALDRLRQALWLVSTAATALFAGVVAEDLLGVGRDTGVAAVSAAAVALQSGLLWRWRAPLVQQATCLIGVSVVVGTGVSALWSPGPAGIALWLLGAAYLAIGLRRLIVAPLLAVGVGALTMVAGAGTIMGDWQGAGLLAILGTGLGLATLAGVDGPVRGRDDRIVLGAIGGVALLQAIPSTLGYFVPDAGIVTGLAVWMAGIVLTAVATHRRVRIPLVAMVAGGLAVLGGAALTATQATGFATILGVADRDGVARRRHGSRSSGDIDARVARAARVRAVGDRMVLPRRGPGATAPARRRRAHPDDCRPPDPHGPAAAHRARRTPHRSDVFRRTFTGRGIP